MTAAKPKRPARTIAEALERQHRGDRLALEQLASSTGIAPARLRVLRQAQDEPEPEEEAALAAALELDVEVLHRFRAEQEERTATAEREGAVAEAGMPKRPPPARDDRRPFHLAVRIDASSFAAVEVLVDGVPVHVGALPHRPVGTLALEVRMPLEPVIRCEQNHRADYREGRGILPCRGPAREG